MNRKSTYEISQYELHAMTYRVEATSEAEAIAKLFDSEAEPVCDSLEYIEVAEDFGLPVDEHRDLAETLHKLGVVVGESVIPSIRSIREIPNRRGIHENHIDRRYRV